MDEKWLEENMTDPIVEKGGEFKGTLFLSTDNKMTVSVESSTEEGRKAALDWAKRVYDRLLYTYGSKQAFSVKQYKEAETDQKSFVGQPTALGTCPKCGAPMKWSEKKQKAYCSAICWKK